MLMKVFSHPGHGNSNLTGLNMGCCFPTLTVIHTWARLSLTTHMNASWVNDPQVALTTIKLRAQTCP